MKQRIIRVWRILAVAVFGLVVLAGVCMMIAGGPYHAALRKLYSFLGILGSEPPPKYILLLALILLTEIPFMLRTDRGENMLRPAAEPDSAGTEEEKRRKQPKPALAGRERSRERAEKQARERAVGPAPRREQAGPAPSGAVRAADAAPAPELSAETEDFDRFLSELKAELFEE